MTGDTGDDESVDDSNAEDSHASDASPDDPGAGEPGSDAGGRDDEDVSGADPDDGGSGADPDDAVGETDGPAHRQTVDPDDVAVLADELVAVRDDLADLESRVEDRTVHRDDVTAELKRYVRARQRRGHATGWGPYLVLLYGTGMTLGAFYYLGGIWAILAMVVVWLSTLGLFVVMLITGGLIGAGRKVASVRDLVGKIR